MSTSHRCPSISLWAVYKKSQQLHLNFILLMIRSSSSQKEVHGSWRLMQARQKMCTAAHLYAFPSEVSGRRGWRQYAQSSSPCLILRLYTLISGDEDISGAEEVADLERSSSAAARAMGWVGSVRGALRLSPAATWEPPGTYL